MKRPATWQRVLLLLVPLLLTVQAGSYVVLRVANEQIATETLRQQLQVGSKVFRKLLEQQSAELLRASELVAKDYGFRQAVGSGHRETIDSMLQNHISRTRAGLVALTGRNDALLGSAESGTLHARHEAADAALSEQVVHVESGGSLIAPYSCGGQSMLFQWIKTDVRNPLPTAKLTIGFPIDDSFITELRETTDLHYAFISSNGLQGWRLHASSFDASIQEEMLDQAELAAGAYWTLGTAMGRYSMMTIDLSRPGGPRVMALIGKSSGRVTAPLKQLENIMGVMIALSAVIWGFGLYRVARAVVAPLDDAAFLDNLTGLANRRLFEMSLQLATRNFDTLKRGYAVMVMDLNKFKAINDTLGHAAGDVVLQAAAQRIQGATRQSDTVARLGGDEFVVLLITNDVKKIGEIAQTIVNAVREPILLPDGRPVEVGISIGIALTPKDATTPTELLHCADLAMYTAKTTRTGHAFYATHPHDPGTDAGATRTGAASKGSEDAVCGEGDGGRAAPPSTHRSATQHGNVPTVEPAIE